MAAIRATTRPKLGLRVLVAATILATIVVNVLANAVPFFGRGTGEVSNLYPTLVTPAGYVFAIWGLIYLGLLTYAGAQFLSSFLADDPLPDHLAWPLIVSGVANVVWLLLWQSLNIFWTVPVMLVLLVSLIIANVISRSGQPGHAAVATRWAVQAPLSLYLGWISVATIANISGALYAARWDGWGIAPEWWGVVVLVVGAALAVAGLARHRDAVFAGVFVWAFAGIAVATPASLVQMTATALAVLIAVGIVLAMLMPRR